MPDLHHVASSSIDAVGYDSDTRELYVRFLESGATYVYHGVEAWVFEEFLQADSKGGYFSRCIRPNYPFEKL